MADFSERKVQLGFNQNHPKQVKLTDKKWYGTTWTVCVQSLILFQNVIRETE